MSTLALTKLGRYIPKLFATAPVATAIAVVVVGTVMLIKENK